MRRLARCSAGLLGVALAVLGQEAAPPSAAAPEAAAAAVAAPAVPAAAVPVTPAAVAVPQAAAVPAAVPRLRGLGADPGMMFRLARQMDTNGNLLVEEKELSDGISTFAADAKELRADLLNWLDKDQNGSLSPEEWRPFYTAMGRLSLLRSVDTNDDLVLQDAELDTAFSRMAEFCQTGNDRTLQQFDRDRDGKLSEEELQAARQALQRFMMPGHGGGAVGAARGAAPAAGGGKAPAAAGH